MKVLYVSRLFSGLEKCLVEGAWRPTGVPTIHRVIERLDRTAELRLILTDKDAAKVWRDKRDRTVTIKGLAAPVLVLAGSGKANGRLSGIRRELRHAWRILLEAVRSRPDLIYVDHGNAVAAGLLARLRLAPVVFRVMGVYPVMRQALEGGSLALRALRWAYRAPFALVICTEDGSGGSSWLAKALRTGVRAELRLNGADMPPPAVTPPPRDERTNVLFVGKLENEKGCDPFLAGFLRALERAPGELQATIVGSGSRAAALRAIVEKHGAGKSVTFFESVPHSKVLDIQRQADIYVSLNRYGNFSNANLEAMRVGACMIMPAHLPDVGVEDPTPQLLPSDAYAPIPAPDAIEELADRLLTLHRDYALRMRIAERMKASASRMIPTWQERIDWEMDALSALARKDTQVPRSQIVRA